MFKYRLLSACMLMSLGLTACHDDNQQSQNNPPVGTQYSDLSGTAAIGAAIKGAEVKANCKSGVGFTQTVKTDDNGNWAGQVTSSAVPCALEVKASDTQTLHGYAAKAGNVNITPFTDLAIALATQQNPSDWFKTLQTQIKAEDLNAAVEKLNQQLKTDGYVLPENFDLFTTKFAIKDVFDKALDAFAEALKNNQATVKDYAALVEKMKTGDVAALPDAKPTSPAPGTATCTSKNLPVGKLSDLTSYNGEYSDKGAVLFTLNAATGTAVANGTTATIQEVCGANVQKNGTNFYVITDKGYVTLFKDNAGKYSAESADFSGFYAEKTSTTTATLCESNGADDKLGFKNAPNDFCGFTKARSVENDRSADKKGGLYSFYTADDKQWVTITVDGSTVTRVRLETPKYEWSCGIEPSSTCTGVTVKSGQINSKPAKSFYFDNTVLKAVTGTTQDLTIKKNSLLMHIDTTTTPAPTGSCNGNTNQWGCLTITGLTTPLVFEHNSISWKVPNVRQFNASNQTINVQFNHKSTVLDDSMTITKANANSTYVSFSVGGSEWYQCGTYASEASVCAGLTLDASSRTLNFNNVQLTKQADASKVLTANGILKF